jgi:hypothetical protein
MRVGGFNDNELRRKSHIKTSGRMVVKTILGKFVQTVQFEEAIRTFDT